MSFNINKLPFFSIIVPVYNTNESYLKSAIESVINQTFKDYELIIVDDASTINYKIPENVKYIRNETNRGTLYSRKIGAVKEELYICNNDSGFSNKDISEITIDRFEKNCLDTKTTLKEFHNFLCSQKAEILHYYDYLKLSFNQYKYLMNKTNNEKIYLDILNKYFDSQLIEGYNRFERIHKYYLIPLNIQEEINKKLLPYFFSIIFYGYYINVRIFGIAITIKTAKCYDKPIVISLNNLLRNIFSINSNGNEKFIKLLGLRFCKKLGYR